MIPAAKRPGALPEKKPAPSNTTRALAASSQADRGKCGAIDGIKP